MTLTDDQAIEESEKRKTKRHFIERSLVFGFIGMVLGSLLTMGLSGVVGPLFGANAATKVGQTEGKVALTEGELRTLILDEGVTAYWVGPIANCMYSLEINSNHQVLVRYLPDGKGVDDTQPNYRVIATYPQADAFTVTKTAGNQANAISFVNGDGAQIYYNKALAKNVYLAYQTADYEVEIYDPIEGASLSLATASGKVVKIQ